VQGQQQRVRCFGPKLNRKNSGLSGGDGTSIEKNDGEGERSQSVGDESICLMLKRLSDAVSAG